MEEMFKGKVTGKAEINREHCCGALAIMEVSYELFEELSRYERLVITNDKNMEGLEFDRKGTE